MSIKKLAGQTLWYGIPSIATRFIGYILNFSLIFLYRALDTADLTQIYAIFPFLNILFTYGVETGYFRFIQQYSAKKLYQTLSISLLVSTVLLTGILLFFQDALVTFTAMEASPQFITWMAYIVFFDTLSTLPFAKLRQEERPRKYAFIKMIGVVVNVLLVFWYIGICPGLAQSHPGSLLTLGYHEDIGIGYYLIGNIVGSVLTFLLLLPEFKGFRFEFDTALWKEVMRYSMPLIIVGLGGMINDMLSRLVFQHVTDLPAAEAKHQLGVFAANYRLAILITIFIQMFRMAAEPFFFNQSKNKNAPETYARVMHYFVMACSFMFLMVGLYLDVFKTIMTLKYSDYGEGIHIVPILAMGGVFLGIYYNLSIWYKLTNRNWYGAGITLAGAIITILLNILWIPKYGYTGSAWATFICYLFMMLVSYAMGQKYYRIPYDVKTIGAYLLSIVLLTLLSGYLNDFVDSVFAKAGISTLLLIVYVGMVMVFDRKSLAALPVVGRYFGKG
ncbi:MAG: polysaccharide biosynthesis C-terminal domain-containing protein [Chitinophagaceae bacterium]|nr:polysaccharide biosynthesis C-terminal domain-containing protein [Chitinophagaceae bacterium]